MKRNVFDNLKINDMFLLDDSLFIKIDEYNAKSVLSPEWEISPRLFEKVEKIEDIKDFELIYPIFKGIEKNGNEVKVLLKQNSFTDNKALMVYDENARPYLFIDRNIAFVSKEKSSIADNLKNKVIYFI